MSEINERSDALISELTAVWEKSVRMTHLFLSEAEILNIKNYVPQCLKEVKHLVVAYNDGGLPIGFMGAENSSLEMLFIAPDERGKGLGSKLVNYAIKHYDIKEVTVNEQNPQAIGFYEHLGFCVYKRTDFDEQGNPYPLLYMHLQ